MSNPDPINSSSRSNPCPGGATSSDCITIPIQLPGGKCGVVNLTDVLYNLSTQTLLATGCCSGSFPPGHVSGYTGNWVDFSADIPLTGSGSNYIYTISNFGTVGGGPAKNIPGYRWTKEGDLSLRGSFDITINPASSLVNVIIPLTSVPVINFPTNWTAAQSILVEVSFYAGTPNLWNSKGYVLIDYPTGILYLYYFVAVQQLVTVVDNIDFGGSRFNLA